MPIERRRYVTQERSDHHLDGRAYHCRPRAVISPRISSSPPRPASRSPSMPRACRARSAPRSRARTGSRNRHRPWPKHRQPAKASSAASAAAFPVPIAVERHPPLGVASETASLRSFSPVELRGGVRRLRIILAYHRRLREAPTRKLLDARGTRQSVLRASPPRTRAICWQATNALREVQERHLGGEAQDRRDHERCSTRAPRSCCNAFFVTRARALLQPRAVGDSRNGSSHARARPSHGAVHLR